MFGLWERRKTTTGRGRTLEAREKEERKKK